MYICMHSFMAKALTFMNNSVLWVCMMYGLCHLATNNAYLNHLCYCRFMQLISLVPTDPTVLQRLGDMYEDSDKSQSFQYYLEVLITARFAMIYQFISEE